MTLRLRLTLWYTAWLTIVLVIFDLLFHTILARTLTDQVQNTLQSQAERVVAIYEADIDPSQVRLPTTIIFASQVLAQASNPNGDVLDTSTSLMGETIPIGPDVLALNRQGEAVFYTWHDQANGNEVLVYSAPARAPNGQVAVTVQVAQSLGAIEDMLQAVRLGLLLGSAIAVLLAALGGALLSNAALRPLNEIAETASRIANAEDLNQRLEVPSTQDEVGRLAATFNQMMERLQLLFRTQQRLVADVSHELRTPLATMQGNLDLLQRGAAHDPQMLREGLQALDAEVARMSRLVSDLLLLAEADAGVQLNLQPVELDTLLLEVYREAVLMAQGQVKVRLGHEDQAQVAGDPDRLKQLLLNLVSNAVKYTPQDGSITLSLRCQPGWVRVAVADNGIGIAEEDLPFIFDRFWRADKARSRAAGGTGLGLSIAKWIAEAHGGHLKVESEPGKGSTFEVWLPRAERGNQRKSAE